MLVLEGRPVELEAHLRRLDASLSSLFGAGLPRGTRRKIVSQARRVEHGKLRITVIPAKPASSVTISTAEVARPLVFPTREAAIALRGVVVDGGLGAHKWADRALLESSEAVAPGTVPLLVDREGWVLEASRGSLFSVRDGTLLTPPADGRILPGIARRRVIEVAVAQGIETREERLALADLRAGEAFLAGSVRGVEPVRSVDGVDLPAPAEIGAEIATGLKRRWLRVPQAGSAATVAVGRRGDPRAR
jgi:para-aminobenzoate synthetase / 4-amino-4-deoxychorismate lyase